MPEKLLTLRELSEYLGISEEKITDLVDKKVIFAYRIGGELLRFRKEQIEAIRSEIDSRVNEADRISGGEAPKKGKEKLETLGAGKADSTFRDKIADFFYFSDFYILSGVLIISLLAIILCG